MKNKIIQLLTMENYHGMEALFYEAQKVRTALFGNTVFLYGTVYFSTWCINNCSFCYYRKSNNFERCRMESKEIVAMAERLAHSGVNLINLAMGEDLEYQDEDFATIYDLIKQVKKATKLPVMITHGGIDNKVIDNLAAIGTDGYAFYHETHNEELFGKLRVMLNYDERMNTKLHAKKQGMLIEEGILVGIGESMGDIADSILKVGEIGIGQITIRSFLHQKNKTRKVITQRNSLVLKIIAIVRILYPNILISVPFDDDGAADLQDKINAGANVVTSIIQPITESSEIALKHIVINDGRNSIDKAGIILKDLGLKIASVAEYRQYLENLHIQNNSISF